MILEKVSPSEKDGPTSDRLDVAELFAAHAQTVAVWASRLAGPTIDPEDVVQEVFVVVHRQLARFRRESSITTWLYGITANVVRQHRRKAARRRWFGKGNDVVDELPATPTPLEEIERKRRVRDVYRVLDAMRDATRTVLILSEIEGLSGEQIAELTQTKIGTVWVRVHRARAEFIELAHRLLPPEEVLATPFVDARRRLK